MGYKTGKGLGKQESGIVEPLNVHIKRDRSGLGEIEEKIAKKSKQVKNVEVLQSDFKQRMAQKICTKQSEVVNKEMYIYSSTNG